MIDFRPHTFQILSALGGGIVNGDPVAAAEEWGGDNPCRFVKNGKDNVKHLPGGTFIVFEYVVYCDIPDDITGKTVRLFDKDGNQVCQKEVHSCNNTQLHTILYIQ
ncbi:MAG: hypothetical protein M0R37_12430 [Bacteroidales bacterium]|nr:hypothetical protein [Bacteroidales bacterium]